MIEGMYTTNAMQIKQYRRLKPYFGWLPNRDFSYLDSRLLNVSRDLRKSIAANVKQSADSSLEFAHKKLKIEEFFY